MYYYLAASIVQDNQAAAELVAKSWNDNWTNFFTSGLFAAIIKPCLGIALLFFVISAIKTIMEWSLSGDDNQFHKLIIPFVVLLFLVNGGSMTITGINGLREISNNMSNVFLEALAFNQNVNKKVENLVGEQAALKQITQQAEDCKTSVDQIAAKDCSDKLTSMINTSIANGSIADSEPLRILKDYVNGAAGIAAGDFTAKNVNAVLEPLIGGVARVVMAPFQAVIFFVLQLITSQVQNMAEASMMLTALIAPLFITTALLPNGSKSIIALFTAFWGIINYKFCYIIIVGLVAQMTLDKNGIGGLQIAATSAIFAPILAAILAGGAGMGFAKAAASAAGNVAGAASGGMSQIASTIVAAKAKKS